MDTGADLSVHPRPANHDLKPTPRFLLAANGTQIPTYGEKVECINFGLSKEFEWKFIIADVDVPIIGSDFFNSFQHFG